MINYFNKTKNKLLAGLIICMAIFIAVLLIMVVILALSNPDLIGSESWTDIAIYIFLLGSGLSIFIMILAFVTSYQQFILKERMYNKQPFTQLTTLGFHKAKILDKSYWVLIEEVWVTNLNHYWIVLDVPGKNQVTFNFLYENPHPSDVQKIETGTRGTHKESNTSGLTVSVEPDTFQTPSTNEIKSMLDSVTLQLHHSGLIPHATIKAYEKEVKTRLIQKAFAGLG